MFLDRWTPDLFYQFSRSSILTYFTKFELALKCKFKFCINIPMVFRFVRDCKVPMTSYKKGPDLSQRVWERGNCITSFKGLKLNF